MKKQKPTIKQKLESLLAEYGTIAFVVYLSIFAVTITGFYIAIATGLHTDESTTGSASTLVAAWLAAKLTTPLRLGATVLLTPFVAALIKRFRRAEAVATVSPHDTRKDEARQP